MSSWTCSRSTGASGRPKWARSSSGRATRTYDVMVLLDGTVAVLVGSGERMRELAIQRPRDLMAELNILTGQRVHATGVVREAGSVLVVPADEFRALLGRELVFGDSVLQTLFRRRQAIQRLRMGIQIVC